MQTLGSLIDALCTVDLKMWNAQEGLYKIRHMTFGEFQIHLQNLKNMEDVYNLFKKSCDLNYQRNQLIDEIDQYFVKVMDRILLGTERWEDIRKELVQIKHKTY